MMDDYNMSWYLQTESKRIEQEVKECRRSSLSIWLKWINIFPSQSTADKYKQKSDIQEQICSFSPSSKPN